MNINTTYEPYELFKRNNLISQIIGAESKNKYFDEVDLVILNPYVNCPSIYGSKGFNMIAITKREDFHALDQCFVIKDEYFSIFSKSWSEILKLAEYENPSVNILRNFTASYKKTLEHWIYYYNIADLLDQNMQRDESIYLYVSKHFIEILRRYDDILATYDFRQAFKYLYKIIKRTEYIIFMLNHRSLPNDLKSVKSTILQLDFLPDKFAEAYEGLVSAYTLDEIKKASLSMIICLKKTLDSLDIQYQQVARKSLPSIPLNREPITDEALTGTCELIYSKWRTNMYTAIKENNRYLSFMTMAKCQELYNEMYKKYDIPFLSILEHYNPHDLSWNANVFEKALSNWFKLYQKVGKKPNIFGTLNELENYYEQKVLHL